MRWQQGDFAGRNAELRPSPSRSPWRLARRRDQAGEHVFQGSPKIEVDLPARLVVEDKYMELAVRALHSAFELDKAGA